MTSDEKIKLLKLKAILSKKSKTSNLKTVEFTSKENLGMEPRFNAGLSILSKNSSAFLTGRREEKSKERICIVAEGSLRLNVDGKIDVLNENDCLFVPPFAEFEIENDKRAKDVKYAWAMSSPDPKKTLTKKLKIIRTLNEITPKKVSVKGMERAIYSINETKSFHFALFLRGSHTFSPMHTHIPKDFEESFIVLDGKLKVSGIHGETYVLGKYDCAFVPPYSGNKNENTSSKSVRYVWIGSPPVDVKEIPVETKYSRYEKDLSVDKN